MVVLYRYGWCREALAFLKKGGGCPPPALHWFQGLLFATTLSRSRDSREQLRALHESPRRGVLALRTRRKRLMLAESNALLTAIRTVDARLLAFVAGASGHRKKLPAAAGPAAVEVDKIQLAPVSTHVEMSTVQVGVVFGSPRDRSFPTCQAKLGTVPCIVRRPRRVPIARGWLFISHVDHFSPPSSGKASAPIVKN